VYSTPITLEDLRKFKLRNEKDIAEDVSYNRRTAPFEPVPVIFYDLYTIFTMFGYIHNSPGFVFPLSRPVSEEYKKGVEDKLIDRN
jgi:hypothetical protein